MRAASPVAPLGHAGGRCLREVVGGIIWGLFLGCAVGPTYQRPELPQVENFRDEIETPSAESIADLPWWELFQDASLRSLIEEALRENRDLHAAASRVVAARARAGIDEDALLPAVQVQAGASRQRRPFIPAFPGVTTTTTNQFGASVGVSWELDVWGRLRRAIEASQADFQATVDEQRGVILMLVADVAQAYLELLQLDALFRLYEQTRDARNELLQLFEAQLEGGTGTLVQTSNAAALVYGAEAMLPQLAAEIRQKENQVSTLLGRAPGLIPRGPALDLTRVVPEVPAGLPATLLERRPDLRQLEQNLRAAVARIGVAEGNLLPPISLTGLVGLLSTDASKLFSGGAGEWLYGAQTSWLAPILSGKSLRDVRDAAVADAQVAAANYQQGVLRALADVGDALAAVQSSRLAAELFARQVEALQTRLELVLLEYHVGTASYVEVTLAYEDLLPAQVSLVQAQAQRSITVVQLYRALGGGWATPAPPEPE